MFFCSYCLGDSGSNGLIFTKTIPKFWNSISIYSRKIFVLIYSFVVYLRTPQQFIYTALKTRRVSEWWIEHEADRSCRGLMEDITAVIWRDWKKPRRTSFSIQGCWYVLSPTKKETSYSDRRFWCSYFLFIIIIGGILVLFIYTGVLISP